MPDINDVIPMEAIQMDTADQPITIGCVNKKTAITVDASRTKPHSTATGGPRRDWKSLSEIKPPEKPPMMPKTQVNQPQWAEKYSAPPCFTAPEKTGYHSNML